MEAGDYYEKVTMNALRWFIIYIQCVAVHSKIKNYNTYNFREFLYLHFFDFLFFNEALHIWVLFQS